MNIIIILLIFVISLFLYLHVYFHLKTSDDLEVFELAIIAKERLEEICDLRQPLQMDYDTDQFGSLGRESILKNYASFDIKLRDVSIVNPQSELYLPIALDKGAIVIDEDKDKKFISEGNHEFLEETSLIKEFKSNDEFFRPDLLARASYDIVMGSQGSVTPLRYENSYRNYFMALNGPVKVKLTPPKSGKYLHPVKDYDNYEFRSPVDIWEPQPEYATDFKKIKCLDIVLEPGKALFIPAYWWYSFKFDDTKTTVLSLKYRTYMNTLAIAPSLFLSFLQRQNTFYKKYGKK